MKVPGLDDDPEKKSLLPPLDLRERLRLAVKVVAVVVAYLWFERQPATAAGPAAATAFAAGVGSLSLIELVWLRNTSPRERIFTSTRRQAVVLHVVTVLGAAAALVAAVPRLP